MSALPNLDVTLMRGKYHGTSHEHSPSAWIHEAGHGPDLSQTEHQGPDFNIRVLATAHLRPASYFGHEVEQADIARVCELVKRVNAYPRLVETLQALADSHAQLEKERGSQRATHTANARNLLRELGEEA